MQIEDLEFDLSSKPAPLGMQGDAGALAENLTALVREAREHGTNLILMTYPSKDPSFYHWANSITRSAARQTDTSLIDLTATFKPHCPKSECPAFLLPDQHPTARGYRLVAETILRRLTLPPKPGRGRNLR